MMRQPGGEFHAVEVTDKLPEVENISGLEPSKSSCSAGELEVRLSGKAGKYINQVIRQADEKALKILLSVPEDMAEGSRRIIECPVCGHKVYVLRDAGKVRVSCGGCKIDASGLWRSEKND